VLRWLPRWCRATSALTACLCVRAPFVLQTRCTAWCCATCRTRCSRTRTSAASLTRITRAWRTSCSRRVRRPRRRCTPRRWCRCPRCLRGGFSRSRLPRSCATSRRVCAASLPLPRRSALSGLAAAAAVAVAAAVVVVVMGLWMAARLARCRPASSRRSRQRR
jgi:hypothetical protein